MQRTVSFFEAIQMGFKKYFDFTGRSSRSEYWWWKLFIFLIFGAVFFLFSDFNGDTLIRVIQGCIFFLIIPTVAVTVRRLHDVDKSGWLIFLYIVPFGVFIIAVFCLFDSDCNFNEYGPIPNFVEEEEQY